MINRRDNARYGAPKKRRWKIVLLIIGLTILSLIVAMVLSFVILRAIGRAQMLGGHTGVLPRTPGSNMAEYEDDTLIYDGVTYRYNEDVTAVLCMGVDLPALTKKKSTIGNAGQADAVFLGVLDTASGRATILPLPRDAMAEIDIYSISGAYIGTQQKQLCVAYAYGDGRETSCECMVNAASRLLYGMPISSYIAIDFDAITVLNRKVGGIDVVCNETGQYETYQFTKGQKLHLNDKTVIPYLRARNMTSPNASALRLERQIGYLKAFSAKALEKTRADLTFPVTMYNTIKKHAVTDLNVSRITYLTTALFAKREDAQIGFCSIPGTTTIGEDNHVEFYPDEDALYAIVLDLFYKPVETE